MSDRGAFASAFNVPRETMAQFDIYSALLTEWQQTMNLVGPATLPILWTRHFADSAQLLPIAGRGKTWLDIGAGAGFPGLVIALLDPQAKITLVESIAKKCRFLAAASDALGLGDRVTIENRRVESLPSQSFDIITARALATMRQILLWSARFAGAETRWLLPKGASFANEIIDADRIFRFDHQLFPSHTEPAARLILAKGLQRR